ncbi:Rap1a/Tai family immunity protein [Pseudomonas rhodesiae]|uniref:Rap1a/Tai family immunity protein n=1 Tax=Pseudomonas rhodesiae TaxID=76760 RepID=UPI0027362834|nr:Rap1a/Tai family immunity protein [Pseudomonas rhodesiae]WLG39850.1 Rap1a/Tai family immunity protein [Pseudomonas rhodesiae]
MKAGISLALGLVGALVVGEASAADAKKHDGNFLLSSCNATLRIMDGEKLSSSTDQIGIGQCLGLVEGVRNTLVYLNDLVERDFKICWPEDGIPNGQAVRILVKYLNEHPADLSNDQTLLTMIAFKSAYPCRQ